MFKGQISKLKWIVNLHLFFLSATWHQYDDAILGEKGLLQSFLNMIWRNTDAAEGRTIATLAMLPRWEGFWVGKSHRDMTAWEAIEEVKDVAYCMTQSYGECNRVVRQCVPRGYVFDKVGYRIRVPREVYLRVPE